MIQILGAAGAVSKITGAMGKGLSALTFDKDYQKKRRDALNKKPTSMQEGLARGGKGSMLLFFLSYILKYILI
jgi:vacuolar protein sorting-associated protein 13A/C